jgi:hypothetical protein
MSDQNKSAPYDTGAVDAALQAFGQYGDPQTVLAEALTRHHAGRISDLSIAAYVLMFRYADVLNRPSLRSTALLVQRLSAATASPKDIIEMAKALSLFDYLKGVSIMGGK